MRYTDILTEAESLEEPTEMDRPSPYRSGYKPRGGFTTDKIKKHMRTMSEITDLWNQAHNPPTDQPSKV